MTKEQELMDFLHAKVFDDVLNSRAASRELKQGIRLTIVRLQELDARGMIQYFWSAIVGTERSTRFSKLMKDEGFNRFEEVLEEFRDRFNDAWLRR